MNTFTTTLAFAAAAAAVPLSSPLASRGESGIQAFSTEVKGADKTAFPPTPDNLDQAQKDFLAKYQPLSEAAFKAVEPVNQNSFSKAGFCFSDYPCLSVNKVAAAKIGDKEEIEREQVATILDQLTSSPSITFDKVHGNHFSGLKISSQGAVLDVIAAPGTMDSKVLGGMVFDMFKLQSDDVATNSIRATQAKTDDSEAPLVALCLYPEGADAEQTYNFCVGKELDGSSPPATKMSKRDGGLSGLICSFIDIPLIC